MLLCDQRHTLQPNKIAAFIEKNISLEKNSVWDSHGYANLIIEAASHLTYLETVSSRGIPSADVFQFHIKNKINNTETIHINFLKLTEKHIKGLKNQKVILIIDETDEPFYGNINNNPKWIHEYKPDKGCTGSFKFLCVSILIGDKRYFIDAIPLNLFYDMKKELEKIFDRIASYKMRIEVVLMDRGFSKSSEIINLLNQRKLRYLMLYPEYENVKRIVKEVESYKRMPFEVKGIRTTLVIIRNEKYDWKFVTNLRFVDFVKYIKVYKKRWNIETGFRVADEARIKTKSLDIKVRYFLFLVTLILYNIWYFLGKPTTFKRFMIRFFEILDVSMPSEMIT